MFAYYCGIDRDDPIRRRIVAAPSTGSTSTAMSDEQAALQIARDGVDILVDLNGYTKFARTRLFSFRPAPVQVNWFGYPATMGTPYHHYIIADAGIIPEGDEIFYSEEVARLPCYQPNDRLREVAKTTPKRSDFGLPDDAFVYCSFNATQKLTQRMFDSWLTILASTPGSVLWMLKATEDANARLDLRRRARRGARKESSSPKKSAIPNTLRATRSPTCSSTASPTARIRRARTRCGWASPCLRCKAAVLPHASVLRCSPPPASPSSPPPTKSNIAARRSCSIITAA